MNRHPLIKPALNNVVLLNAAFLVAALFIGVFVSYSPDKPDGPGDAAFHAAYKKKAHHLWSCMNAKGYHFTEQWSSDW
jgi:hypothetical protein